MQQLTQAGEQAIHNMAQRYGVSADAVRTLLFAVSAGGGSMAQFYHPELGGGGQWMQGGMTMVGDMFNHGLQALVANLCAELSSLLANQQVFQPTPASARLSIASNSWWPPELGAPSATGGQNDMRYAYFPQARRLAIAQGERLSVYDTLDHQIGGVQQQQGGGYGTLSFSSQYGTFTVESLPRITPPPEAQPAPGPGTETPLANAPPSGRPPQSQDEILNALERLGRLQQSGVLSEEEFRAKKAELLARL